MLEGTIVIETKQADHEIDLEGSETSTEVSTSTSSESSTPSSGSSTTVSTSTTRPTRWHPIQRKR